MMDLATLKEQAERCRRLAKHADPFTQKRPLDLASEYDAKIATLEPQSSAAFANFAEWRGMSRPATQRAPASRRFCGGESDQLLQRSGRAGGAS
jgi:hypothetical protein